MGAETPNQVTVAPGAVFLSHASQDADAARQICGGNKPAARCKLTSDTRRSASALM